MEKNKEYYELLDKRTKEFKEWKLDQEGLEPHVPTTKELQQHADEFIENVTQEKLEAKHAENPTAETSIGLGDVVEKITKVTGIKALVNAFTPEGEDCGCDERKEKLNGIPVLKNRTKIECLTVDEYNYLNKLNLFALKPIKGQDVLKLQEIYGRVFNRTTTSSCTTCSFSTKLDELKAVLKTYKDD